MCDEKEKCSPNCYEAANAAETGCQTCASTSVERRLQALTELEAAFIKCLLDLVDSGKATPGHLKVINDYLKDRGFTMPELLKKARMENDAGAFDEDFDESELIH